MHALLLLVAVNAAPPPSPTAGRIEMPMPPPAVPAPAQPDAASRSPGFSPAPEPPAPFPPRVREDRPDAILTWNALALDAIRAARTPPPLAARNLAMLHVGLSDTTTTINRRHRSHRVHLRAVEPIDLELALNACGQRILAELFPRQATLFDRQLDRVLAATPTGRPRSLALSLGRHVGDRILAWRRDDGSQRPTPYEIGLETGVWRPTPAEYASPLLPGFGDCTPLGVPERRSIRFEPPPTLDSRAFVRDLDEVRRLGDRHSRTRTAEQSIIAWFWNDGAGTCTPPGHWNQIAREVALTRQTSLDENARLFALLNLSLADAAIFCWNCKYRYRLWRPVTAIRNAEVRPDPDWLPLLPTPPFPSYTSGHSTFSGAGATVLSEFFGSDEVEFTIGSDGFPGSERQFRGFWEAAREAGRSRIYGGIHYECDNREGLVLGKAIAREVIRSCLRPRDPTDPDRSLPPDPTDPGRVRPVPSEGPTASYRRERP